MWQAWLENGVIPSALAFGLILMDCVWQRSAGAFDVWSFLAHRPPFPAVALVLHAWGAASDLAVQGAKRAGLTTGIYQKMASMIEYLEAELEVASAARVLSLLETYSMAAKGQWLKVAGGPKSEVLAKALSDHKLLPGCVAVEYGLFVGYTALRLAYLSRPKASEMEHAHAECMRLVACPRIVSLELDPVHACIARHIVELAELSRAAEHFVGHAKDIELGLQEIYGEQGCGFAFMDQKGTCFHDDLAQIERTKLPHPGANLSADNCLKPGAPVFNWHTSHSGAFQTTN
eukprot:gnl/MRDRNA2_/MRDRNA2_84413_c0_seq2.p1 gnl/MRDRNA2_/MRDRNA2_84413_c0~~gnl/MRDRNA2_/MRDRNA2_84413_c0_seq2.p1  ORF type:complete len:289 (+),score=40.87 gnl/MRDRNA2_/MRDRNA2_84413_c0_seq2:756-1622(+)